jgi:F-type H+-transporting ATPase subunit a
LATVIVALFSITNIFASDVSESGDQEKEFSVSDVIMHHISDSYEYHFWGEGDHSVSIPLPVILYNVETGKLSTFLSSKFEHGHAEVDGYKLGDHGITSADGAHAPRFFDLFGDHHISFYDFSITKNVFAMLLSFTLLILVFGNVARAYKKRAGLAPKGMQNLMESIILFVRDEIAAPNINAKKIDKFMPYLLTVFFFIWINNLIGLIPFFPGGANLSGNIAFTATLAIGTYLMTTFNANKDYWKHIFWMPGVPVPFKIFLIPIELIGTIAKPFALMMRLFANITAGHIVVLSLISLIFIFQSVWVSPAAVGLALFINVLELLVAFLQAFVFTMLTALFIGAGVEEHAHH